MTAAHMSLLPIGLLLWIIYFVISSCTRLRPYSVKSTVSRPNCAVKPLQALSVLRWGTTWESGVP
eukprot:COSAG06_NODE_2272_length_7196_cov_4.916314_3_plen_65_part_00